MCAAVAVSRIHCSVLELTSLACVSPGSTLTTLNQPAFLMRYTRLLPPPISNSENESPPGKKVSSALEITGAVPALTNRPQRSKALVFQPPDSSKGSDTKICSELAEETLLAKVTSRPIDRWPQVPMVHPVTGWLYGNMESFRGRQTSRKHS